MTGWLIVAEIPSTEHTGPAWYALIDTAHVGSKPVVAVFNDEHHALAVSDVLNDNEQGYRDNLAALDAAEPF